MAPNIVLSISPSVPTCNNSKNDKRNCSKALCARLSVILLETISSLIRPDSLRLACHQEAYQIICNTAITLMRDGNVTEQNKDMAALMLSHVLYMHVTWRTKRTNRQIALHEKQTRII